MKTSDYKDLLESIKGNKVLYGELKKIYDISSAVIFLYYKETMLLEYGLSNNKTFESSIINKRIEVYKKIFKRVNIINSNVVSHKIFKNKRIKNYYNQMFSLFEVSLFLLNELIKEYRTLLTSERCVYIF
jgi:hypothetical protein